MTADENVPTELSNLLDFLDAQMMALDEVIISYFATEPDVTDACVVLIRLNRIKNDMKTVYDSCSNKVGDLLKDGQTFLPDGYSVEKKWAVNRTGWKHKDLAAVVAKRITDMSVDMDSGEILMSREEMVQALLNYMQPSYWKVTSLREIGINPDHYSQAGEAKPSLILRKPKEA